MQVFLTNFSFSILIEWNKLLFDVFIPRAWSNLLNAITTHFPTAHIFSAWPVAKHFSEFDSAYWASFPKHVLDTVLANNAAVWPAIGQDVYKRLEDVFVAYPSTSDEVIQALADTGMSVCRPPEHLFRMIEALPDWDYRMLTPERTSDTLRVLSYFFQLTLFLTDLIGQFRFEPPQRASTTAHDYPPILAFIK